MRPELLNPPAGVWWYENAILCWVTVSLFAGLSLFLILTRKPTLLLATFIIAHPIVFILNGSFAGVATYLIPTLLLGMALPQPRSRQRRLPLLKYCILLLALLAAAITSGFLAASDGRFGYSPERQYDGLRFLVWPVLGTLFVLRLPSDQTERQCKNIFRALAAAGFIVAIQLIESCGEGLMTGMSLLAVLSGRNRGGYIHIPMGSSNTIAAVLAIACVCGWGARRMETTRAWRNALGLWTATSLVALALTLSRGAIVAMVIAIYLDVLRKKRAFAAVAIPLTIAGVCVFIFEFGGAAGNPLRDRFFSHDIQSGSIMAYGDDITSNRMLIWETALLHFGEYPIAGVGFHNYGALSRAGQSTSHNLELNVLLYTGILGFIPFSCLCVYLYFLSRSSPGWRMADPVYHTLATILVVIAVNTQVESPEENIQYAFLLGVLVTMYARYMLHLRMWRPSRQVQIRIQAPSLVRA